MPFVAQSKNSDDKVIIEAYGGSSTAGVVAVRKPDGRLTNVIAGHNEMHFLSDFLQKKYGKEIEVVNKGKPSAQAIELLYGTYRYKNNERWADEMKKSTAKIIILNFATNDARHFHFKDVKPSYVLSPEQYEDVMSRLVTIARKNGKEVILQEPHPLCGKAESWNVSPFNARLDSLAKTLSVPLVKQYQRIQAMPDWQKKMSPDCIHPSSELYKIKAEESYKVIDENFTALLAKN
ncbi:SGNH/GDSL hydrolase family protein [Erwinia sp. P6884]|uniref:SGNH/GDSL hydrolase family protein n=1 Tax=Erwinia sp. P6884 TaxID=3141450 RepID=UPI00318FFC3B